MALTDSRIFCLGASHTAVPLDILERLSVPETELAALLRRCNSGAGQRPEILVLSTCNRTEIYGVADPATRDPFSGVPEVLLRALEERSGMGRAALAPLLYRHRAGAAEIHLLRVIAGLDSLVVGETQIIGQVSRAFAAAQLAGTAGPSLSLLFQSAIRASRRTRRHAEGLRGSSVGTVAVERAAEFAGELAKARIILLGTGEMGRIILRALQERGARDVEVVTRAEGRAAALSARWGRPVRTPQDLPGLLPGADIVISATSSSQPLLTAQMVRCAVQASERPVWAPPRVMVDVAVPRTIERAVGEVPGVRLLDIDSLKEKAGPRADDPAVMAVIAEEMDALELRMAEVELRPVIGSLWRRADGIRAEVLAHTRARVPDLDEKAWQHVENLARALVAKVLHDPATRLRAEAGNGHARAYAEALRHLFDLTDSRQVNQG